MAKIFPFGTKKNPKPTVPPAGDQTGRPSRPLLAYRIAPFIVFLLLFEGVIFGWYYVKKSVNQQAYAKFEAELEEAKLLIKDRIDVYIDALYGLQALFAASREVERGEWAEYIRASGFRERYPGIVAFAYVEVVPRNRVGPFVESVRKDTTFSPLGFPNFDIYPVGEREEYYVTKYIEPYRGNEEMLGFDAGTRPERLSVMKEARDTGEPVATGRVRLLSEGEEPVGFLIFLPIYRLDAPISTAEERRAALIGFVEAIFKADDLLSGIFGKKSIHPEIGFQIYDGGAKIKRKLLYDDEKVLKVMYTGFRPRFTEDRTLEVAGRLWTLYFSALPKFGLDKTQEEFPIYVLLGGTLFSVLIFGVLYSFSTSRSQAVSIAEKMTSKLRQSEHRYADLIENAPDPIITLDRMGRLQSMNPMAEKISGYRAQELLGRYFATMNILTVPSLSKALSEFALAVVGKERPPFELDLMTREGDQITVEANPRPIKEGGKTVAIQVIFRDITARKKTERTLRDFGTYLDKIINSVGDPIFVKDRKHRLVLLNDAYCHLIGTGREELLGKTEKDVFPKEEARVSQAREEDVFRTGKENVAEENFTDSHGITHIIVSKRTLYTDTKGDAFIVGIIRDVTDQKQAEENIRQLNQILRRRNIELSGTNKELEAFSYSVSHDLRAPLRAINGFSNAIAEDCYELLNDQGRHFVDLIRQNAQRMGRLIDDLLAFSRLGRKAMNFSEIDMAALVREVFEELKVVYPDRDIVLEVDSLPPGWCDPAMMRQVLANLLSNALKFTARQIKTVIQVGGANDKDEVIYFVKDNGVGFDAQYADKLFGVFQRLHGADEFEGSGVGLAIVQRIIHRHGGRVWAESVLGEGAVFYFTLPFNAAPGMDVLK